MFRSEKRALRVVEYHLDLTNGQKMKPSEEMRAVLSKYLNPAHKHLLTQI